MPRQEEGFFTLELSTCEPVVDLPRPDLIGCALSLNETRYPRDGDVVMGGGCSARCRWRKIDARHSRKMRRAIERPFNHRG